MTTFRTEVSTTLQTPSETYKMKILCIFIMVLKLSYFHKLEDTSPVENTFKRLFPGIVSPTVSEDVREAS